MCRMAYCQCVEHLCCIFAIFHMDVSKLMGTFCVSVCKYYCFKMFQKYLQAFQYSNTVHKDLWEYLQEVKVLRRHINTKLVYVIVFFQACKTSRML